jgi:superfamily II helicase
MNPFKPSKRSNRGKPRLGSTKSKRRKICSICGRETKVRLISTPQGWKCINGKYICSSCLIDNLEEIQEVLNANSDESK